MLEINTASLKHHQHTRFSSSIHCVDLNEFNLISKTNKALNPDLSTIRKCQVVHWNSSRVSCSACDFGPRRHHRPTRHSRSRLFKPLTLNLNSARNKKRWNSSTFISVCKCPEGVRLLVQIPPARLERGDELCQPSDPGAEWEQDLTESTTLLIGQSEEELLGWPLARLDLETGVICLLTFNAPFESYHLARGFGRQLILCCNYCAELKVLKCFLFSTVAWWAIL